MTGCVVSAPSKKVFTVKTALHKELRQQPLTIEGEVPLWLRGSFVRNGPVHVEIDGEAPLHWFDGLAMIHGFKFDKGKIYYSNRFLRTDAYHQVFDKGNINYLGFDNPRSMSMLAKIKLFLFPGSAPFWANANVNVAHVANQRIAVTEIPSSIRFDINTMNTLGPIQYQDNLPQKNCFESAHMQFDRRKGEKINYIVKYGLSSDYIIYRLLRSSPECVNEMPAREVISKLKVKRPAYMHSFAITQHYIILVEFPFLLNPLKLMFSSKPFIENFVWQPERGTNFLIFDRKTGKHVATLKDNAFFAFHHVNAYEKGEDIILDIVTYNDACIIQDIKNLDQESSRYTDRELGNLKSKLIRYTLSMDTECVDSTVMLEGYFEFPRINETHNAYPYRYIYGADPRPLARSSGLRPLYKIDTRSLEKILWQEAGTLPGEPVFIPAKNANDEDEGVIISLVLDLHQNRSFLLVLDAKTFQEIARAATPFAIPIGLHGQFFE